MSYISRPVNYVTTVDKVQFDGYGVPSDGIGGLGDRYYDLTAGRWYLKRWVGNMNGVDRVFTPNPLFGATQAFSLDIVFSIQAGISYPTLATNNGALAGSVSIQGDAATNKIAFVQPTVGSFLVNPTPVIDGLWHKARFSRSVDGEYAISVDGGAPVVASPAGLNTAPLNFYVGGFWTPIAQHIIGRIARVSAQGYGRTLDWCFCEGTGGTIIDKSGNGNDGTLADGTPTTFWLQTWVPTDLL